MKPEEIMNFRNMLNTFSLDQLKEEEKKLNNDINKMILDSDLIMKVAIVRSLIEEKGGADGQA